MNLNIEKAVSEGRKLASNDKHRYALYSDDIVTLIDMSGATLANSSFILAHYSYCVGLLRGFRKGKKQASKQASINPTGVTEKGGAV